MILTILFRIEPNFHQCNKHSFSVFSRFFAHPLCDLMDLAPRETNALGKQNEKRCKIK